MGRRVLITGGGSGIGKAMATTFAAEGARVLVTDMDGEALAQCPGNWLKMTGDASDPEHMQAVFTRISDEWGGIDVVCANAGIAGPTALVEDVEPEDFRRCLAVNLEGAFLAAKFAAPIMKAQQSGVILITSSNAGINGFPNRSPYSAAKWAVIGLMKTLAMELGPYGIRANAIAPGCVEGPRINGVIEREAKAKGTTPDIIRAGYEAGVSMRAFVTAQDVANMAAFLASDGARLVSGQVIPVDGHTENPDPKV
ncbi:NAD(P)-dependent dehydrogenase (short-subunit alcohol dehydrogenase family) [Hoeflea halophila]|uniref:NAD(P)-dependent dehydrogenase (Short-subunit alcohol dehydrogenase family) n=1 Tax=Hoeflea halophila TaxID=714899 RepID=A0A286IDY9_9HYPH|nr:SDR family oxidoreductase [Hoeflea halophila]SOE18291.1 NAD(P)-dependent dehydrogenase (short-subunit alcohol dehydrogenase family) [Hoeflea halophila]